MKKIYLLITISLVAVIYQASYATDIVYNVKNVDSSRPAEDSNLFELGFGAVYHDIPILGIVEGGTNDLDPTIFINGRYQKNGFFVEAFADSYSGVNIGYNVLNSEDWSIDIIGSQQSNEISDDIDDRIAGLDDRETDFTAGLRVSGFVDKSLVQLELLHDISGSHDGFIINATLGTNWQIRNWNVFAITSARYQSDDVLDYYFGINESEAAASRFTQYTAGDGIFYTTEIGFMYPLNEKWVMQWDVFYGLLPDDVSNSPLALDDKVSLSSLSFRYVF